MSTISRHIAYIYKYHINSMKFLLFIILLTTIYACDEPGNQSVDVDFYIDSRLQVYFDRFKAEGALRDIDIDFVANRIDGYINNIRESGVAGQCETYENDVKAVVIDRAYWETIDDITKEFVVFHELGHCYLNRVHLDDANANGTCKSMMNSGGEFCAINYREATRKQYIDELFSK